MADSVGSAVLTLSVDDAPLRAGLDKALQQAQAKGKQIEKALEARQSRVDQNQTQILRLQRESLTADNQRLSVIRTQIAAIQQENREQQAGIGVLKQKLAINRELESSTRAQIQAAKAQQASVTNALGAFAGGLPGLGGIAGLGTAAGLAGLFTGAIQSAMELESITRKLSNTLGQQGAGGALAFTKGLADQLGLSFTTLSGGFASFTAAATAANVPLEQQKELFGAVSKAAQALGLSNDEISGSLLALQQIASKGTVSMEELRGQLGERLPIALSAAARGLGVTQQELIKLVESGGLASERFFPALTKGLNELTAASGGAPTAAQNLQMLANAWKELQVELGTNLLPGVTSFIKGFVDAYKGAQVINRASKLGIGGIAGQLGFGTDEGAQVVGTLQSLQQRYSLTERQANALFTDAVAKSGGNKGPQLQNALGYLDDLAQRFRERNPDVVAIANAEGIAANKQAKYQKDLEVFRRSQLPPLQQLQLKNDDEQRKLAAEQMAAATKYESLRQSSEKDPNNRMKRANAEISLAELQSATLRLKQAMIEGAAAIKQAVNESADRLFNAREALTSNKVSLAQSQASDQPGSLNSFLRGDDKRRRLTESIDTLRGPLLDAISQANKIAGFPMNGVMSGSAFEPLLNILDKSSPSQDDVAKITNFINSVQQETRSIRGVNQAQSELDKINRELVGVNAGLRDQVEALASKDWKVYVNTSTGEVSGDVTTALTEAMA